MRRLLQTPVDRQCSLAYPRAQTWPIGQVEPFQDGSRGLPPETDRSYAESGMPRQASIAPEPSGQTGALL
jgi:hypothetical protein